MPFIVLSDLCDECLYCANMPWRAVLFVSVLIGVNSRSHHFWDIHLRQFYRPPHTNYFEEYDIATNYAKTKDHFCQHLAKQQSDSNQNIISDNKQLAQVDCTGVFDGRQLESSNKAASKSFSDDASGSHNSENDESLGNAVVDVEIDQLIDKFTETSLQDGVTAENLLPNVPSHQLPPMYYNELNKDFHIESKSMDTKRTRQMAGNCDCKVMNDLIDLGQKHFPRYLLNAVCQTKNGENEINTCKQGTNCMPLEYKVKVLTLIGDYAQSGPGLVWLPDDLQHLWKYKTVTVTAGCFCTS